MNKGEKGEFSRLLVALAGQCASQWVGTKTSNFINKEGVHKYFEMVYYEAQRKKKIARILGAKKGFF